jgi:hypothetical protein
MRARARRAQQIAAARDRLSRTIIFRTVPCPARFMATPTPVPDTPTVAIGMSTRLSAVLDGADFHSARHSVHQSRGFSGCKCSKNSGCLEASLGVVLDHHLLHSIQLSLTPFSVMFPCWFAPDPKKLRSGSQKTGSLGLRTGNHRRVTYPRVVLSR